MSYHPRIETAEYSSFLTTRSRNSELWFVNNPRLEEAILGYAAKFSKRYEVKLYALAIEGNHIQAVADFPELNRSKFMRDFNSCVARAVPRYCSEHPGGTFWARRYSVEYMPGIEDLEDRFFYTVLQAVQDGLVERISDYPGYNCFHDAVHGLTRTFTVVRWSEYNDAKRFNPNASIKDYTDEIELKYERLPGYEHLSQRDYAKLMHAKLEERRRIVVEEREAAGLRAAGTQALLRVRPGSVPKTTKTSTLFSYRPRILSVCPIRKRIGDEWYFGKYTAFKEASKRYLQGFLEIEFPQGMYKPIICPARGPAP